jgi:signal transduction histidine kinase
VVRVEDDGRGYNGVSPPTAGVGLDSMRARAEEIGGRLTIGPREPSGTVVEAVLPAGSPTTSTVPGAMPEAVAR